MITDPMIIYCINRHPQNRDALIRLLQPHERNGIIRQTQQQYQENAQTLT